VQGIASRLFKTRPSRLKYEVHVEKRCFVLVLPLLSMLHYSLLPLLFLLSLFTGRVSMLCDSYYAIPRGSPILMVVNSRGVCGGTGYKNLQGRDRSVPLQSDLRLSLDCTLFLLDSVSCPFGLNKLDLVLETYESSTTPFAIFILKNPFLLFK
jgi:hypothetical protein